MAKKKNDFSFSNFMDTEELEKLMDEIPEVSPTKEEVKIVKEAEGDERMLKTSSLVDYHNHTFKVLDNEDMDMLVDSIKDYGILLPLLVRAEKNGKYEIVSGHRRKHAADILGIEEVPCKVIDVDDDMADIIMADTNIAREIILPSEKAKTYKVRLDAAVRQGKKKAEELEEIADESPDSLSKIKRYLRIAKLSPALLEMIDEGKIPVVAGVTLSSLSEKHRDIVEDVLLETGKEVSLKTADDLKKASARGLTEDTARSIIVGEVKPRAKKPASKEKFTEDMLSDVVPSSILEMPLPERVSFYKTAIEEYVKTLEI